MVRMRPVTIVVLLALLGGGTPAAATQVSQRHPVVFVHGMGDSAANVGVAPVPGTPAPWGDLLTAVAARWPMPDVCQDDAQPGRPWAGSPCVFRYIEDVAEAGEPGPASSGPNDSQSSVRANADKLARELEQVLGKADGARVILVGYSMGGAIIRAYLSLHREAAARTVEAVVLVDAVSSGSWGFTLTGEIVRRVEGRMGARMMELLRTLAASSAAVDLDRPAPNELRPRSDHLRAVAAVAPPPNVSYYTFWGDIRIDVGRRLLAYDLPDFELPSVGDLGLLPGDPDPAALPELGGQRFTPTELDPGQEAWDVPHTSRVRLTPEVLRDVLDACGRRPAPGGPDCGELLGASFRLPNQHTAVPVALSSIGVDHEATGATTLLDAILLAIARNQP